MRVQLAARYCAWSARVVGLARRRAAVRSLDHADEVAARHPHRRADTAVRPPGWCVALPSTMSLLDHRFADLVVLSLSVPSAAGAAARAAAMLDVARVFGLRPARRRLRRRSCWILLGLSISSHRLEESTPSLSYVVLLGADVAVPSDRPSPTPTALICWMSLIFWRIRLVRTRARPAPSRSAAPAVRLRVSCTGAQHAVHDHLDVRSADSPDLRPGDDVGGGRRRPASSASPASPASS